MPKNTSIMWWEGFAVGGTGVLHKIYGIMRVENYVDILKQHLKTSVRKLKLGCKWTMTQAYFQSCGKMA
jgi:hypothetical protein